MMSDPIADMLTRIRNAVRAGGREVEVRFSRLAESVAKVLLEEGYIKGYTVSEDKRTLKIEFKSKRNTDRPLTGLKRVSRPGLRVYANKNDVPKVLGDLGDAIISTSSGVMTGRAARRQGLGGEVIAYVW